MEKCLLCKSEDLDLIERIKSNNINHLYNKRFGIIDPIKSETIHLYQCNYCLLNFFLPIEEAGDERLYETLQEFDWYYLDEKPEFQIALPWLEKAKTILEVGAGSGSFSEFVGNDRYIGLEFNDAAIANAREKGINLLKESVQDHVNKENRYDAVVAFQVLEHVPDVHDFLKSCVSCLKPEGILLIAVPSHDGICGLASNNILDMPPHHITRWSTNSLKSISHLFNLECIHIEHEPVAPFHKEWAERTIILSNIKKKIGMDQKLIDRSLKHRILTKLVSIGSKFINVPLNNVIGHTVVSVYKKL